MPFGQAGVEPALIVSEAVLSSRGWVLMGMVEGVGRAGLGSGPGLSTPLPHRLSFSGGPGSCGTER